MCRDARFSVSLRLQLIGSLGLRIDEDGSRPARFDVRGPRLVHCVHLKATPAGGVAVTSTM